MPEKPTGNNGWYTCPVTIMLSSKDEGSGVDYTMYKIDNGAWKRYVKPFIINNDGTHVIQYYSVDKVGNKEEIKERKIRMDMYGPEIIISKPLSYLYIFNKAIIPLPGDKPLIIGKITIEATIKDITLSGVESTKLYVDNNIKTSSGDEVAYTLNERLFGNHVIKIIAYDVAGNEEVKEIKMTIYNA